jgi:hypothetical protein
MYMALFYLHVQWYICISFVSKQLVLIAILGYFGKVIEHTNT